MISLKQVAGRVRRFAQAQARRVGYDVIRMVPIRFHSEPAPDLSRLDRDPHRLDELRRRYRSADPAVIARSAWDDDRVAQRTFVEDGRFRSESMYVWQYVNSEASVIVQRAEYRYFTYLSYLERRDERGLLEVVDEDGAFGAPMFAFPGRRPVSRDVLDSVNEILYLHRRLGILDRPGLRVLDIGAGYGRLAHRMAQVVPDLADYACIDAIPESTYVCERYLAFRGVAPPGRIIELPDAPEEVQRDRFDLAINIHSFSEMPASAVEYWVKLVAAAEIPALLVVPNAPTTILSYEEDGRRVDMGPVFEAAGYELVDVEPTIDDPAAQALFGVHDHFHLFRLAGGDGGRLTPATRPPRPA